MSEDKWMYRMLYWSLRYSTNDMYKIICDVLNINDDIIKKYLYYQYQAPKPKEFEDDAFPYHEWNLLYNMSYGDNEERFKYVLSLIDINKLSKYLARTIDNDWNVIGRLMYEEFDLMYYILNLL